MLAHHCIIIISVSISSVLMMILQHLLLRWFPHASHTTHTTHTWIHPSWSTILMHAKPSRLHHRPGSRNRTHSLHHRWVGLLLLH
uniref:Uncharacterized protein n=1 Tax=Amphimedon queenslandica TaxID=400682 RepID=A0A1X7VMZ8_AMPQE